jgi:hypothetical protein
MRYPDSRSRSMSSPAPRPAAPGPAVGPVAVGPTAFGQDPLASPAVPPAAPSTHPWRDRVVIALFALGLTASLAGAIAKRNSVTTEFENRNAAPWPAAPTKLAAVRPWAAAFEAAFADRFGGRDLLIAFHHWATAIGFGVSPVPNALIGRDGWLYFLGEDGRSVERDYRGVIAGAPDEAAKVAAEFKRRYDFLSSRGIAYVVMVVPDKATIYPEHLPSWATRVSRESRLDRLYTALAAYPEIAVLDIRPALVAAKARERVYYMTDSHWNVLGASVGYNALAAAVKARLPSFPGVPAPRPPYTPGVDFFSGDITTLMGLRGFFREDDVAPFSKLVAEAAKRCAQPVAEPFAAGAARPPAGTQVYACDRPELPSAIVLSDSMVDALVPLLSDNFRRVIYVPDRHLDRAFVEREQPDLVIEEVVERNMHMPTVWPM